ncbi:MAG TPA: bacterial transcriptional activator domain-containing protein [Candidatus Dormibacteraeota bacterium]|nr:bacterial transcriptional activator domain-containing protein [Candidatus Dormibacteraeota bacterium]
MPPELAHGLEVAALWLLVLLLVPKRRLGDLRLRLHELRAGRRRWLFEPPGGFGSGRRTGVQRSFAEAVRIFDLGVPLYVAGRLAEERSAHVRLEARSQWPDSVPALIATQVLESSGDVELAGQLRARGLLLPAEKAVGRRVEQRQALGIKWWLERGVGQAPSNLSPHEGDGVHPQEDAIEEPSEEPEAPLAVKPKSPAMPPTYLGIETLGGLGLRHDGHDFGPELMGRPVIAFIWLYLLLRSLTSPKDRVMRADLADELTPGMSADKQRTRLRNRLSNMLNGWLPAPLAARMVVDQDESVRLDLTHCSIDLFRLEEMAAECVAKEGILSPNLVDDATLLLDGSAGEFLPGWEQLEKEVNGARGAAGDLVRQLRQRAETARIDLMGALAANLMARQEPSRAIPLLEQALERQPDREDLARKLRAAYLETGQHARAAELQKDHALDV